MILRCHGRSSQANIERLVAKLVGEVNSGKREGSVISECSLGPEDKKSWREFRKELESVGITPDLFRVHRSFIISKLRNSLDGFVVNEMDVVEEVEEDDDEAMEDAEEEIEDIDLSMGEMGRVTSTQRISASLYKATGGQNRRSHSVNKPLPTDTQTPVQSSSLAPPFQNYDPPAEVSTDNEDDDFAMTMAYLDDSTSLPQQNQRNKGLYYPNPGQSIAYLQPVSPNSPVAPQTSFEREDSTNSITNGELQLFYP